MTASARLETQPADPREDQRLSVLDGYDILDTQPEDVFDSIADLIRKIFEVETGLVTMIDGHRQWYKAVAGGGSAREVPVDQTFCRHIVDGTTLVVPDAREDDRFADNPMVTGAPHVRFYAGAPLRTRDGYNIGTVCAIGDRPRAVSPHEIAVLESLARVVVETLELRRQVTIDTLTGTNTRGAFREQATRLVALARRHRARLCAICLDLDHFKAINDTYGHAAGDRVLASVATAVGGQLRRSDVFGRLGGEEFSIVLPETDARLGLEVAEKLRKAILALQFPGSFPPIRISASLGIAVLDPGADDLDSLLDKADRALYAAKKQGRNRSTIWEDAPAGAPAPTIARRRVLKAASIVFNNRMSTLDCTVRALAEDGAEISVSNSGDIADEFTLRMRADGFEWRCRVTARRPTGIDVAFI